VPVWVDIVQRDEGQAGGRNRVIERAVGVAHPVASGRCARRPRGNRCRPAASGGRERPRPSPEGLILIQAGSRSISRVVVWPVAGSTRRIRSSVWARFSTTSVRGPCPWARRRVPDRERRRCPTEPSGWAAVAPDQPQPDARLPSRHAGSGIRPVAWRGAGVGDVMFFDA
jgi:hypothetical protein